MANAASALNSLTSKLFMSVSYNTSQNMSISFLFLVSFSSDCTIFAVYICLIFKLILMKVLGFIDGNIGK